MFAHDGTHRRMLAAVFAFAAPAFLLTACNDDPLFEIPPDAPTDVSVAVQGTSATVSWTPGAGATSQEVRMSPIVPVPASAGTALLVEDDHVQTFADNTTSSALFENLTEGTSYSTTVTAINGSSRTSSDPIIAVISPPANAPVLTAFALGVDPLGFNLEWTPTATPSENYRVVLTGDDGEDPIMDLFPSSATSAFMSPDVYPIVDGVTYTAQVFAVNGTEEIGSNTLTLSADLFPWDDYFPTSLHEAGQGKTTYYDAENGGFERFTGVPYEDLACIGCHSSASGLGPVNGRTCDRCHLTVDPPPGDEVDTTWETGVCMDCHSRQKLELSFYTDVHRDSQSPTFDNDCMACHTMGDVHGDGTVYASLQDIGAIDAQCTDCHDATTHPAGNPHGEALACVTCHAQSTVTCNNCHFEAQVNNTGKFFLTPPARDWVWLGNRPKRDGSGDTEVYVVNYQSVTYQDDAYVAFGAYTPHTIGPAATARGCTVCHANLGGTIPAIEQYNAEGIIDVASWDAGAENMVYPTGVVPLPEDYLQSLKFDFATTDSEDGVDAVWTFLKAGADTIRIPPQYVTPLSVEQMGKLGMVAPAP